MKSKPLLKMNKKNLLINILRNSLPIVINKMLKSELMMMGVFLKVNIKIRIDMGREFLSIKMEKFILEIGIMIK